MFIIIGAVGSNQLWIEFVTSYLFTICIQPVQPLNLPIHPVILFLQVCYCGVWSSLFPAKPIYSARSIEQAARITIAIESPTKCF
jgi:hypothetical protein